MEQKSGPRRLLCDEMLIRLAHWLRAAGHDTLVLARGLDDTAVLRRAEDDGRVLLTCDRALADRVSAPHRVVLLASSRPEDAVSALAEALDLDWRAAPWSRCLDCNVPVDAVTRAALGEDLPPDAPEAAALFRCPACQKVYWAGSHVRRFDRRLAALVDEKREA